MRPATKVALALAVLFLIFLGYVIVQGLNSVNAVATFHHDTVLPSKIETACLSYMAEYGRLPPDADNQKLAAALMGDNSHHITFITFSKRELNADNEIIDHWGTPLRVVFQGTTTIQVISAGPDKIFDTPDDIVSNNPDNPPKQ